MKPEIKKEEIMYSNPFDNQAVKKTQIKFEANKKEINKYEFEKMDEIVARRRRDISKLVKMEVDTENGIFTQAGLSVFDR